MTGENQPLTAEDLQDLKDNLKRLDAADDIIDKAIRGGIDMTDQKKRTAELRTQLQRMKQSFFPGQ